MWSAFTLYFISLALIEALAMTKVLPAALLKLEEDQAKLYFGLSGGEGTGYTLKWLKSVTQVEQSTYSNHSSPWSVEEMHCSPTASLYLKGQIQMWNANPLKRLEKAEFI